MIRTIQKGSGVQVQGELVTTYWNCADHDGTDDCPNCEPSGRATVRVGDETHTGTLIERTER